ncbi:hypothetical protein [Liquorilactobacillus satsumensis]|uniref:Uncharacterized protein n=1 Tax=Liquorilactobacillus satsumensis DSM 16230 = JCM 12392 TaxID=1423801 RepID=A0A0R1V7M6_9LACO|nr:hypothetical protein [Liquorilactobacillus satsumensis]KRL99930.1 hypothetical protein FD50_GL002467 [Liquorilactobacillus satsumensis DSM 16230 = JCM 12392]MCC7665578.1 hypothetical protein [Liquorilactobacillus satsumensis]MCP9311790.1 hypothetical protein [Liquorilactobacillus satsumensis]MCP9328410.1 hypothetical protein [Liquorilactobacillus satsumensis]MCP9357336.1 hypothetical protein [Liquorilactobacillus satsumensis]
MGIKERLSRTARQHSEHKEEPKKTRSQAVENSPDELSRAQLRKFRQAEVEEEKKRRLGRKLNWIILFLVIAIVIVYCFMIFVNF